MRVLYLHQHFKTDSDMGGTRSYEFSRFLARIGNEIFIITGRKVDWEKREELKKENINIISTKTVYSNKMSFFRRIFAFIHYLFLAIFYSLRIKKIDLVFASSTPLTVGIPGVLLKKIKGCKLIFETRDIWPDVPIEMGIIKNRFLIWLLRKSELIIYNNADHIISLSEGMKERIVKKGKFSEKISVITNISNLSLFNFNSKSFLEDYYGIRDSFVCIHPGTMGYVNGLGFVLEVAEEIQKKDSKVIFLLIGEGKEKEFLLKEKTKREINNVLVMPGIPKRKVVKAIKEADLGLMIIRNQFKVLEHNSANKFFDFLAAGKPVLINYGGWQKEVLERSKAGFSEITVKGMAERIIFLKENTELNKEVGNNALKLAQEFSLEKACEQLKEIVEEKIW